MIHNVNLERSLIWCGFFLVDCILLTHSQLHTLVVNFNFGVRFEEAILNKLT